MDEKEESVPVPPAAEASAGPVKKADEQGGLASWEEPHLPFNERIRKYWRQMIVHLWGPAGSVVLHILGVIVLVAFAVNPGSTEVTSEPVVIETQQKAQEIEKPVEQQKVEDKQQDIPDPVDREDTGISNEQTDQPIGGAGNMETGTGLGSGDPSLQDKGFEVANTVKSRLVMKGLYANRTAGGRTGALGMFGGHGGAGTNATEQAVLRALRWLKKNQESNGSWKGSSPVAMTSFAVLAYLAHGEKPEESEEFGETVKKALDFLVANQTAAGTFTQHDGYTLPIGTYALCEAYGLTQHPTIKSAAVKAITTLIACQHATGGFNYINGFAADRDDTSVMAWCCQALKAGKMAGLEPDVPGLEAAIKKAIGGMKLNYVTGTGGFCYCTSSASRNPGGGAGGLSGAGALCLQLMGAGTCKEVKQTMVFLQPWTFSFANPQGASPLYYWYYITQAKFHDGEETFRAWNKLFSPELVRTQMIEKNAIEDAHGKLVDIGHWESPSKSEAHGGIVQDTCLCTLMLEVYYRYLPSFKHVEAVPEDVAAAAPKNEDITIKIK